MAGLIIALTLFGALDHGFAQTRYQKLKFSPDGRHILAQSDTDIALFDTDTFRLSLRLRADNMGLAAFTPDSKEVVFVSGLARVTPREVQVFRGAPHLERWNIRDKVRVAFVPLPKIVCGSTDLAPDGNTFACVTHSGSLLILDGTSGEPIKELKRFAEEYSHWGPDGYQERVSVAQVSVARLEFSPDGRFLVAYPYFAVGSEVVWDGVEKRLEKRPRGVFRDLRVSGFAFLTGSTLVHVKSKCDKCPDMILRLQSVPDGKVISEAESAWGDVTRTTDPALVIVMPPPLRIAETFTFRMPNLVEVRTGKVIVQGNAVGLIGDALGDRYLSSLDSGVVCVWQIGKGLVGRLEPPR